MNMLVLWKFCTKGDTRSNNSLWYKSKKLYFCVLKHSLLYIALNVQMSTAQVSETPKSTIIIIVILKEIKEGS